MSGLKRFQSDGFYLDYTPSSDVTAGDVVVIAGRAYVADDDIKADALGALARHGVYTVPKEADGGVTFAAGAAVYWDDTNDLAVAADGGGSNALMGYAIIDDATRGGADADGYVRVKMSEV